MISLRFSVNILTLSHGCGIGWISPSISYLKSSATHLVTGPLTAEEISWIGSFQSIGGVVGTIIFGLITEKLGKRNTFFLLAFPHTCFWILVLLSTRPHHLYAARFLAGLTGGGHLRNVSLFIAEISENKIRGFLASFFAFAICGGTLLSFIAGAYLSFFTVPLVFLILPATYLLSFLFLHDSPASLIARGKNDEAFESLKFYRTCGDDDPSIEAVKDEFELLKLTSKREENLELKDFCKIEEQDIRKSFNFDLNF